MSDFIYNWKGNALPVTTNGDAAAVSTYLMISNVNKEGQDLTRALDIITTDAYRKIPFDIELKFPSGNVFVTVNNIFMSGNRTNIAINQNDAIAAKTDDTVELVLGMKTVQNDKKCGGYEQFTVSTEAKCQNGCYFENVDNGNTIYFDSLSPGTYDMEFEGPSNRYQVFWYPPSGEGCDPDRTLILNRVSEDGKSVLLEDYGKEDQSKWDFNDLVVTVKNGSFEWSGNDFEPVYYITTSDATLCQDGYTCDGNGNCVPSTPRLRPGDLIATHAEKTDKLYNVRADSVLTRVSGGQKIAIYRDGEVLQTGPFACSYILDDDLISIYRPEDNTNYTITGKQYKFEFCYNPSDDFEVRLYPSVDNDGRIDSQKFFVEVDDPTGDGSEYEVIYKVRGLFPSGEMNPIWNVYIRPPFPENDNRINETAFSELEYRFFAAPGRYPTPADDGIPSPTAPNFDSLPWIDGSVIQDLPEGTGTVFFQLRVKGGGPIPEEALFYTGLGRYAQFYFCDDASLENPVQGGSANQDSYPLELETPRGKAFGYMTGLTAGQFNSALSLTKTKFAAMRTVNQLQDGSYFQDDDLLPQFTGNTATASSRFFIYYQPETDSYLQFSFDFGASPAYDDWKWASSVRFNYAGNPPDFTKPFSAIPNQAVYDKFQTQLGEGVDDPYKLMQINNGTSKNEFVISADTTGENTVLTLSNTVNIADLQDNNNAVTYWNGKYRMTMFNGQPGPDSIVAFAESFDLVNKTLTISGEGVKEWVSSKNPEDILIFILPVAASADFYLEVDGNTVTGISKTPTIYPLSANPEPFNFDITTTPWGSLDSKFTLPPGAELQAVVRRKSDNNRNEFVLSNSHAE